jgi:hypothetical protein
VCPSLECFDRARRARSFGRALRGEVDGDSVERLRLSFETDAADVRGLKVEPVRHRLETPRKG